LPSTVLQTGHGSESILNLEAENIYEIKTALKCGRQNLNYCRIKYFVNKSRILR
jgi:hypothetical protein